MACASSPPSVTSYRKAGFKCKRNMTDRTEAARFRFLQRLLTSAIHHNHLPSNLQLVLGQKISATIRMLRTAWIRFEAGHKTSRLEYVAHLPVTPGAESMSNSTTSPSPVGKASQNSSSATSASPSLPSAAP
eukprot:1176203-Prorocentrum_minimum.AAC.2